MEERWRERDGEYWKEPAPENSPHGWQDQATRDEANLTSLYTLLGEMIPWTQKADLLELRAIVRDDPRAARLLAIIDRRIAEMDEPDEA